MQVELPTLIKEKHPLVARKIQLAIKQLSSAKTVEEFQQIGILIRDAWIDFAQKLFSVKAVPTERNIPSPSDAKEMLKLTINLWPNCPKKLIKLAQLLYDLANEVQHDTNVNGFSARWNINMTILAMCMITDFDLQHEKLADRRYYKCPICGSLNLSFETGEDIDPEVGPIGGFEIWKCPNCTWDHYLHID